MDDSADPPDLGFLADARHDRAGTDRRRRRQAHAVSGTVTVVWLVAVTVLGHWGRVVDNVVAGVTMLAGSFVAGATPQGGGAVAFPVFTKALDVPAEVARTFSLCIQTVGMGAASVAILVTRRAVSWPALAAAVPAAVAGFGVGLATLGDRTEPFWPSVLPGPYVKVGFTLLVAAMACIVFLGSRVPIREVRSEVRPFGRRQVAIVAIGGFAGGIGSSLVGSGADVALYVVTVVLLGLEPKVAVPTSVLAMAAVSVVGFVVLGIGDGQLDTAPAPVGSGDHDLFGLWLAAVPVVAWGAPLGSAFASRLTSRGLAAFVAALAAAEVVSTVLFVEELRSNGALVAFAIVGGMVLPGSLWLAARHRSTIAGVRIDLDRTVTRRSLDVAPDYRRALGLE